ncbi:SNF2 family N-terminal domain-containing protein [Zopfochytrium polystomum]|nr:SNF2 family N-terminal domain-containing protein [Zopfochytrium polystomum]
MKVKASAKKSRHDSDVSDYESYGDDSEAARSDSEDEETRFIRESEMFDFFNKADLKEFLDTLMCSEEQATSVFGLRPFESVEDLRSKLQSQKRKKLGGLMDKYDEIMRGYSGVDSLIRNCEDIGDSMMAVLKSWSSSTKPSTPNSQASDEDSGAIACLTEQPALLNGDLRLKSYQLVGVSWINLLHTKGCGGILADEMGLGKTAQVIAFLCLLKEKGNNGPHLVIVPSSTIENWMREFERWAPVIDVIAYYGSQSERSELRMKLEESPVDVVLTTYNLACSSKEDRAFLKKLRPHSLILDEGHMMKNMNSSRFKHINSISSSFRLLLTGTPLQNNLMQLLSLLTFILPGLFKDAMQTLKVIFSTKPSAGQDPNSSLLSQQRIVRAKKMMTPFVLRRKKCLVLTELPAKERFVEYCQATPSQAALYQSIVADCKKSFLVQKAMVAEETSEQNGRKKGKRAEAARKKAPPKGSDDSSGSAGKVNILMQLRKAANHPLLFRRLFTDAKLKTMAREIMKVTFYMDANYNYIVEDMTVMTDFELHQLAKKFKSIKRYQLTENCWMDSGKIQKLKEILPDMIEKGDRVLIFSQFVVMLDILEAVLQTMGLSYLRLDGQTQVIERLQNLIDQFTEDSSIAVFLLSTKAGGLGLNLTVANVVILHDMDFNPHNDAQAEDRAHRVGQTRNVRVVKLVLENSVEEHILRLADAKLSLDKSLQDVETSQDSNGSSSSCSSSGGALASQDAGDGVDGGTAKRKRRGRRNGEDNDDEDEDEDSGGGGGGGGGTAGAEGDEGGGGGNGDRISARNDRRVMELLHDEWFGSGSGGGGRHDAASKSNGS